METNATNGASNVHYGPDQPLPEQEKPKEDVDHAKEERWLKIKERFQKAVDDLQKKPPSSPENNSPP